MPEDGPPTAQPAASPSVEAAEAAAPVNGQTATAAETNAGDSGREQTFAPRSAPPPGFGPPPGFPAQSHAKAPLLANGSVAAEAAGTTAGEPGPAAASSPASTDGGAVMTANGVVSPQQSPLKGRNSFLRSLRTRAAEGGGDAVADPPAVGPVSASAPTAVATEGKSPHVKAAAFGNQVPDALAAKLAAAHLAPPGFHAVQPVTEANGHHHQAGSRTAAAADPRGGAVLGLPAEEEAFLRSLGWSEGAGGEDGGLTDAEIAAHRVRHSFAVR